MRENFSQYQEINPDDANQISSRIQKGLFDRVLKEIIGNDAGVFSTGLTVKRLDATQVTVSPGLGLVQDTTQPEYEPQTRPIFLQNATNLTLDAADASLNRIDIIVAKSSVVDAVRGNREFKNALTGAVTTQETVLAKDFGATLEVVKGVLADNPVAPATPDKSILLAEVYVSRAVGIQNDNSISDKRTLLHSLTDAISGERINPNSITTAMLKDRAVTEQKLALGAVTQYILASTSIYPRHFSDGSVDARALSAALLARFPIGIDTVWYSIKRKYSADIESNTEHEVIVDTETSSNSATATDRDGNTFALASYKFIVIELVGETESEDQYLKYATKIGSNFTVIRGDRYFTARIDHVIFVLVNSNITSVKIYYSSIDSSKSAGQNNRANAPYIGWVSDTGTTDLTINFDAPGISAGNVYTHGALVQGETDTAPSGAVAKVDNDLKVWTLTDMKLHIIGPDTLEAAIANLEVTNSFPSTAGKIFIAGEVGDLRQVNITWSSEDELEHIENFMHAGERFKFGTWNFKVGITTPSKNTIAYGGYQFSAETISGSPPSSGTYDLIALGRVMHYNDTNLDKFLYNIVKDFVVAGTDVTVTKNDTAKTITVGQGNRKSPYHYAQIITSDVSPYHHPTIPAAGTADTNNETNLTRKLHLPSSSTSTTNGKMEFTLLQKHATSGTLNDEIFTAKLSGQIVSRITTGTNFYYWVGLEMVHYFVIGGSSVGIPKTQWRRGLYSGGADIDIDLSGFSSDLKLSTLNIGSQYENNPCTHTEYKLHLWFFSNTLGVVPTKVTQNTNASNYKLQDLTLSPTTHLATNVTIAGFTLSDCEIGYYQLMDIY